MVDFAEKTDLKSLIESARELVTTHITTSDVSGETVVEHALHGYGPRSSVIDVPEDFADWSGEHLELQGQLRSLQREAAFSGAEKWTVIRINIGVDASQPVLY